MTEEITWVNVKDGLPKKKGYYLITTMTGAVVEGFYNTKSKDFTARDLFTFKSVKAWAEMPKGFTE